MIPECVKVYVDKCYSVCPDSLHSRLEYYLKERIVPLLDSGVAVRVNWDSEPMPHKINFQVGSGWVPASKMRGGPSSGANSVEGKVFTLYVYFYLVSSTRKRNFESESYLNDARSKNGSNVQV